MSKNEMLAFDLVSSISLCEFSAAICLLSFEQFLAVLSFMVQEMTHVM